MTNVEDTFRKGNDASYETSHFKRTNNRAYTTQPYTHAGINEVPSGIPTGDSFGNANQGENIFGNEETSSEFNIIQYDQPSKISTGKQNKSSQEINGFLNDFHISLVTPCGDENINFTSPLDPAPLIFNGGDLLTENIINLIKRHISRKGTFTSKLIFHSARDGDNTKKFHKILGKTKPTLTLIKNEYDEVFGGYTTQDWDTSNKEIFYSDDYEEYSTDENAFIFTEKNVFEIDEDKKERAVNLSQHYGPSFGQDIIIVDNFLTKKKNEIRFNNTYINPEVENVTLNRRETYFKVKQLEVYEIILT